MIRAFWLLLAFGVFLFPSFLSASERHDGGNVRCLDCHVFLPLENRPFVFHGDIAAICKECHGSFPCNMEGEDSYFSHPMDMVPPFAIPDDMPLDLEKNMTCMTCHVFHYERKEKGNLYPSLLRRSPGLKLCFACHGKRR